MRHRRISKKNLDVKKTTMLSIVINALQILMILMILIYLLFVDRNASKVARVLSIVTFLVVTSGAIVDIWDALVQRRILDQVDDMDATIEDLESLNNIIRAQRHDFLNHLQVVFSLMEMEEYKEAGDYIEKVYGAITSVSRTMKTANPSVNALLQAKTGACEKAGITVELQIQSRLENLTMPGWELCKVMSNLIDNAMDALEEVSKKTLSITLKEDLHAFRFAISNNGPMIPVRSQAAIFNPGVTGKGSGHGMGLFIVRQTLEKYGGEIHVKSEPGFTEFAGMIPKEIAHIAQEDSGYADEQ